MSEGNSTALFISVFVDLEEFSPKTRGMMDEVSFELGKAMEGILDKFGLSVRKKEVMDVDWEEVGRCEEVDVSNLDPEKAGSGDIVIFEGRTPDFGKDGYCVDFTITDQKGANMTYDVVLDMMEESFKRAFGLAEFARRETLKNVFERLPLDRQQLRTAKDRIDGWKKVVGGKTWARIFEKIIEEKTACLDEEVLPDFIDEKELAMFVA